MNKEEVGTDNIYFEMESKKETEARAHDKETDKSKTPPTIGHVRYIIIQAWLRGFRVKIANFSSFFCPPIPKRDLDTKETTPKIEV